ncbi:hypothetical protein LXL04_029567 [Taraxacum kok-saghyz]
MGTSIRSRVPRQRQSKPAVVGRQRLVAAGWRPAVAGWRAFHISGYAGAVACGGSRQPRCLGCPRATFSPPPIGIGGVADREGERDTEKEGRGITGTGRCSTPPSDANSGVALLLSRHESRELPMQAYRRPIQPRVRHSWLIDGIRRCGALLWEPMGTSIRSRVPRQRQSKPAVVGRQRLVAAGWRPAVAGWRAFHISGYAGAVACGGSRQPRCLGCPRATFSPPPIGIGGVAHREGERDTEKEGRRITGTGRCSTPPSDANSAVALLLSRRESRELPMQAYRRPIQPRVRHSWLIDGGNQWALRFVAAYRDRGRANLLSSAGSGQWPPAAGWRALHISGYAGAVACGGSRQPRCLGCPRATFSPPPIGIGGVADREGERDTEKEGRGITWTGRCSTPSSDANSAVALLLSRRESRELPMQAYRRPIQPRVRRSWLIDGIRRCGALLGPDALLSLLRQVEIQVPLVVVKDPNEWGGNQWALRFVAAYRDRSRANLLSSAGSGQWPPSAGWRALHISGYAGAVACGGSRQPRCVGCPRATFSPPPIGIGGVADREGERDTEKEGRGITGTGRCSTPPSDANSAVALLLSRRESRELPMQAYRRPIQPRVRRSWLIDGIRRCGVLLSIGDSSPCDWLLKGEVSGSSLTNNLPPRGPDALLSLIRQVEIQVPLVVVKDPNEWGGNQWALRFVAAYRDRSRANLLSSAGSGQWPPAAGWRALHIYGYAGAVACGGSRQPRCLGCPRATFSPPPIGIGGVADREGERDTEKEGRGITGTGRCSTPPSDANSAVALLLSRRESRELPMQAYRRPIQPRVRRSWLIDGGNQWALRFVAAYRDRGRANLLALHISGYAGAVACGGSRQPRCLGYPRATFSPPPIGIAGDADREGERDTEKEGRGITGTGRCSTPPSDANSAVALLLSRRESRELPMQAYRRPIQPRVRRSWLIDGIRRCGALLALHISGYAGAVACGGSRQPRCLGCPRATFSPPPIGIAGDADKEGERDTEKEGRGITGTGRCSTPPSDANSAVALLLSRCASRELPMQAYRRPIQPHVRRSWLIAGIRQCGALL